MSERVCQREGCGGSLEGKRSDARYCTEQCRRAEAYRARGSVRAREYRAANMGAIRARNREYMREYMTNPENQERKREYALANIYRTRERNRENERKRSEWQGNVHRPEYLTFMQALAFYAEQGVIVGTEDPDGCWVFTGGTKPDGHAQVRWSGRAVYVHRWVYEHMVGPIPEDHHLHHECESPPCCNPRHLTPLTPAEHKAWHVARGGALPAYVLAV